MKFNNNKKRALQFSKKLKKNATNAEMLLKSKLEKENIFFYFQRAIPRGSYKNKFYIPDFSIPIKNDKYKNYLFIEVDGKYHENDKQKIKDALREIKLKQYYKNFLIRFTNEEIENNINKVIKEINNYIYSIKNREYQFLNNFNITLNI